MVAKKERRRIVPSFEVTSASLLADLALKGGGDALSSLNNRSRAAAGGTVDLRKKPFGYFKPIASRRYHKAVFKWGTSTDSTVFDSHLMEAKRLLRDLAVSLEAANDKKRVGVVQRVIELLQSPKLHEMTDVIHLKESEVIKSDPTLVEWFGTTMSFIAGGFSPLGAGTAPASTGPGSFAPEASSDESSIEAATPTGGPLAPFLKPALVSGSELAVTAMLGPGLNSWASPEFNSLELHRLTNENGLVALGWALFHRHEWHRSLGLGPSAYEDCLRRLQSGYRNVAYHNACHAVDVTHGVHWLLSATSDGGLKGAAETAEMLLASCLAAMLHDIGHDGHNNGFHVNTESEYAVRYSDKSPLEMHHLATGWTAIQQSGMLSPLPLATRRRVRERLISMVQATDFGLHVAVLNEFKLCLEPKVPSQGPAAAPRSRAEAARMDRKGAAPTPVFSSSCATMEGSDATLVASMAIKVADLSYPSKGRDYALVWIDRCLEEFFEQGDCEKELGLPVGYDRETLDKPKSQIQG